MDLTKLSKIINSYNKSLIVGKINSAKIRANRTEEEKLKHKEYQNNYQKQYRLDHPVLEKKKRGRKPKIKEIFEKKEIIENPENSENC